MTQITTTQVLRLDGDAWCHPETRLLTFDRLVHGAEDHYHAGFSLIIDGHRAPLACPQIATRYQRLFTRRNAVSDCARFDALLDAHAALHDRTKPLVRADHDHALDVWQWVLKLAPDASEALQVAGLFHDIERLTSEPVVRVEHQAADYDAFKQRHAAAGAEAVRAVLTRLSFDAATTARAAWLVAHHERPEEGERELALLNEADALSFFALNSAGYLAYFGAEQTHKKVRYTLRRMSSPRARAVLRTLRLEPELAQMIEAATQPT